MQKSRKIAIPIIIIVVALYIIHLAKINNYIYITQFGPTTSRQMMGYGIKTKNEIIVIDGGTTEDAEQLEKYITENGSKVKVWFITHPHSDHVGAFEVISQNENIEIETIILSLNEKQWYIDNDPSRQEEIVKFIDLIEDEKIKSKIIEPQVNQQMQIDNITAKILGVKNPEITQNASNNSSMVIQIKINNKKILFLGDTGEESSKKLIESQGEKLKSDIVQIAHHGQRGATEELYKIVKPKKCLWPTTEWLWNNDSNGKEDSGPWKTKETRKWIKDLQVKDNYIAKDGTIVIKIY